MFVNHTVLVRMKTLPEARGPWVFDSGGFATLNTHGRWTTTIKSYSQRVERYAEEIGNMEWAAPMDWMCEAGVLKKTGLTVKEHQRRTIESYLFLRDRLGSLVTPVLQGWKYTDYLRHVDMYAERDVDLATLPVVGVGSVCRRGQDDEIVRILAGLYSYDINLHAFGVKGGALMRAQKYLVSSDSMAWSFRARKIGEPVFPECQGVHVHCGNCPRFAEQWRTEFLAKLKEAA